MFQNVPESAPAAVEEDDLPVAAIICIAIGAYVVVIAIILLIRQILLVRNTLNHITHQADITGT